MWLSAADSRVSHGYLSIICSDFPRKLHKCNGFEITFVSATHVVEGDVLFTNHLGENKKFQQRSWSATVLRREDMVQAGCD